MDTLAYIMTPRVQFEQIISEKKDISTILSPCIILLQCSCNSVTVDTKLDKQILNLIMKSNVAIR